MEALKSEQCELLSCDAMHVLFSNAILSLEFQTVTASQDARSMYCKSHSQFHWPLTTLCASLHEASPMSKNLSVVSSGGS